MPRTETTVLNDLIRQIGKLPDIKVDWWFPVERAGWGCGVMVQVERRSREDHDDDDTGLHISVHAHGAMIGENAPRGSVLYTALSGTASPARLTRDWIQRVLLREIETARCAALSFTEADLNRGGLFDFGDEDDMEARAEQWRGMREYFETTIQSAGRHKR